MARGAPVEAQLDRIAEIRRAGVGDADLDELRGFLCSGSSHAIAGVAKLVREQELEELRPLLVAAFDRLLSDPIKRDPGCDGKQAIAEALHALDADELEVFLAGIAHRQMEPVWGGTQDTAMGLRIACANGLVRMRHPDALLHVADLLADPESEARIGAARALAYHGSRYGLPLLRLRVLAGDSHPEVIAECLLAMLRLEPEASLAFVAERLRSEETEIAEAAAVALGESRADGAFEVLRDWQPEAARRGLGDVALRSLAVLRRDEALDYLLDLVASEPGPIAREAIAALGIHRHDRSIRERVELACRREDADLARAFAEAFD